MEASARSTTTDATKPGPIGSGNARSESGKRPVQPHVFHPKPVVDAVDRRHMVLHVGIPTGRRAVVVEDRPRDVLGQAAFDRDDAECARGRPLARGPDDDVLHRSQEATADPRSSSPGGLREGSARVDGCRSSGTGMGSRGRNRRDRCHPLAPPIERSDIAERQAATRTPIGQMAVQTQLIAVGPASEGID